MPNHAHHTFEGGGIALWHITETADELYALLGTTKYDTQLSEKKNDARRAEWLAVRLLIKDLFVVTLCTGVEPWVLPTRAKQKQWFLSPADLFHIYGSF